MGMHGGRQPRGYTPVEGGRERGEGKARAGPVKS